MDQKVDRSCVYMIVNLENGHHYIGSTVNFVQRWSGHRKDLNSGCHHSDYLQNAWVCYGEKSFIAFILSRATRRTRKSIERFWMSQFPCQYNMITVDDCQDFTHSEEVRQKIRVNMGRGYWNGKKFSEEHRRRLCIAR